MRTPGDAGFLGEICRFIQVTLKLCQSLLHSRIVGSYIFDHGARGSAARIAWSAVEKHGGIAASIHCEPVEGVRCDGSLYIFLADISTHQLLLSSVNLSNEIKELMYVLPLNGFFMSEEM